ncbi:DNA-processing protein DprA [Mesorhizobium sp. M0166]|uniref:DNA-processing protein DprA n=1 Tax=unclassified Mesorhizobium TaxID=325217 RepID=UPI00333D5BB3
MLSPDTQATLLLVGQFARSPEVKPLTIAEYNRLAKQLLDLEMRPADIVRQVPKSLIIDSDRISKLLARGTSLALAVERWSQLGIKVIGRGDAFYPSLLKKKLRSAAAPILYLAGNSELLDAEAVCIVGSRNASESGLEFAAQLGQRCASEGLVVVSGDARGVDRVAMESAIEAGGSVTSVLVDALAKAVLAKRNRDPILSGKLVLVTPYDPDSSFTVANAMDRNKYMYALASAAVVVDSDTKGGTWTGAVENEKHRWTRAFVRLANDAAPGNQRLVHLGLRPIANLERSGSQSLRQFLFSDAEGGSSQLGLPVEPTPPAIEAPHSAKSLYDFFIEALTEWLTDGPQSDTAIAERFELEREQVRSWLDRAQGSGVVQKLQRPTRFAIQLDPPSSGKTEVNS